MTNQEPATGKRFFSRVPFSAPVSLHIFKQSVPVTLLDIALKGALVATSQPMSIPLKSACRLVLPLAQDGSAIEMNAKVVHLEGQNVGLACEHIDLFSLTELRRLLELNTGDSERMDRELSQLFS